MQRSTRGIDYQDVPRAVSALADEYPAGHVDPRHHHRRAQLIFARAGVMSVTTDQASFVIPPERAVWVPAGVDHEVYCRGAVSLRTVYVEPAAAEHLPRNCQVLEVSDLLRELIVEATHLPIEYELNGRDGRVMDLIIDEICATQGAPLHVPMPMDPRLVRVCRELLMEPAHDEALDYWADKSAMGRRTFTRQFRRETGMSFGAWRQQVRLLEALSRLAVGESVTAVAFDTGYNSPSAFAAMFRRTFGAPPTVYVARRGGRDA